ncbi:sigma 54-interacting transcriptional regulator [Moorella naiadis]|uniref:sigma 54-interacting transcriptional regulator n=1 Tax=Moorella naiadis (nom. illeg.) TaxID=3093670 RepID=UPI003D9CA3CE
MGGIVNTATGRCRQCYSCVRNCPVKAIRINHGQAEVITERCISCGMCLAFCSQGAKQVAGSQAAVLAALKEHEEMVACLAPSFPAAFPDWTTGQVAGALKKLGFTAVWEVAVGALLVAREYQRVLKQRKTPAISTACYAVVNLVERHFPSLVSYLLPVVSPSIALGRLLKQHLGPVKVAFIGPCIAKKEEIRDPEVAGAVDYVLTFTEIKELLAVEHLEHPGVAAALDSPPVAVSRLFPLPGGLSRSMGAAPDIADQDLLVVEGKEAVLAALEGLARGEIRPRLIDALFCEGCIMGPGMGVEVNQVKRKELVAAFYRSYQETCEPEIPAPDLARGFHNKQSSLPLPSEEDIQRILRLTNKFTPADELNCGACGYHSCREKAIAVYQGLAEIDMCLPYLMEQKSDLLSQAASNLMHIVDLYKSPGDRPGPGVMELLQERNIIVASPRMLRVLYLAERVARVDSTVLILGESGVGKEVVARLIHTLSERDKGPFVKINCGAIPENLLESELFGYERGAFTGANREGKMGQLELGDGGTVFLDEIAELPLKLQVKLLQVLQEQRLVRVGGIKEIQLNIRIISATNKNLLQMVKEGTFREDLYYRLNVIPLTIPPLRERPEDIEALIDHFMSRLNRRYRQEKRISRRARRYLLAYPWPGNVRELHNVIEQLFVLVEGTEIFPEHLPYYLRDDQEKYSSHMLVKDIMPMKEAIEEVEKQLLLKALGKYKSTYQVAAKLGVNQSTVVRKIKKYGLEQQ